MVDWTASMQQTFEFYEVDASTVLNTRYYKVEYTEEEGYEKTEIEITYPSYYKDIISEITGFDYPLYSYIDNENVTHYFCEVEVSPYVAKGTWKDKRKLDNIKSCTITRDADSDTKISATFDVTESVGECYIRVYLVTIQNGLKMKHPLGTFLVQTPSSSFDGRVRSVTMDAYSPLLELTEKSPPFGFFIKKGADVMEMAYQLTNENVRCPVSEPVTPSTILHYDFVADTSDTYMTMLKDLIGVATTTTCYIAHKSWEYYEVTKSEGSFVLGKMILRPYPDGDVTVTKVETSEFGGELYSYLDENLTAHYYCRVATYIHTHEEIEYPFGKEVTDETPGALINRCFSYIDGENTVYFIIAETGLAQYEYEVDELGEVTFAPKLEAKYMQPKWTYTDDNSSILDASITMDHDLYGIPNVVEVVYSTKDKYIESTIENTDINSPTSILNRGRRIVHREVNPDIHGEATQEIVDKYAEDLLSALSSVEFTISYTHGYCPVKLNDCVRLNYGRAGLTNIKAKVIYQNIKCQTGCQVSEKAVFTNKLWR